MKKPVAAPAVQTDLVRFFGGIDTETAQQTASPGSLLVAVNVECLSRGGVKRIDGYERFDGQPAPSAAKFTYLEVIPV